MSHHILLINEASTYYIVKSQAIETRLTLDSVTFTCTKTDNIQYAEAAPSLDLTDKTNKLNLKIESFNEELAFSNYKAYVLRKGVYKNPHHSLD